eukprot:4343037-Prymnesium_polylepis.1
MLSRAAVIVSVTTSPSSASTRRVTVNTSRNNPNCRTLKGGARVDVTCFNQSVIGKHSTGVAGAVVLPSVADPHAPSSMSRPPKLSGLEIMLRTYVVMGHPGLMTMLRTLGFAEGMKSNV